MSGAEALTGRPFRAKNGIVSAIAGTLASLGVAIGTDVGAANRVGFYSNLASNNEYLGVVANAEEIARFRSDYLEVLKPLSASQGISGLQTLGINQTLSGPVTDSVLIGDETQLSNASESVAIGAYGGSEAIGGTVVGYSSLTDGLYGIALGHMSYANADFSVALGHDTVASAIGQIALGNDTHYDHVLIPMTTASTNALTGALVVAGGLGVATQMRVGDNSGTRDGGVDITRSNLGGDLLRARRTGGGNYTFEAVSYGSNRGIWGVTHSGNSAYMAAWSVSNGPQGNNGFTNGVGFYNNTSAAGIEIDSATGAIRAFGGALMLTNGLKIQEGTDATMGVATTVTQTITVNTTKVTANSRIFLTTQESGGGAAWVASRVPGESFTIEIGGPGDHPVAWLIVEPIA